MLFLLGSLPQNSFWLWKGINPSLTLSHMITHHQHHHSCSSCGPSPSQMGGLYFCPAPLPPLPWQLRSPSLESTTRLLWLRRIYHWFNGEKSIPKFCKSLRRCLRKTWLRWMLSFNIKNPTTPLHPGRWKKIRPLSLHLRHREWCFCQPNMYIWNRCADQELCMTPIRLWT